MGFLNFLGGVERQINPFDSGKTFKNPQGSGNKSTATQVKDLGLNFLKGAVDPFKTYGKAIASAPAAIVREVQNKPLTDIQQNVFGTSDSGRIGRKIVGSGAQIGLAFLAPGAGSAIEGGVAKAAGEGVLGKLAGGATAGAAIGAPFNVASTVTNDEKLAPGSLIKSAAIGAGTGALLGGAGAGLSESYKGLSENHKAIVQNQATKVSGLTPSQVLNDNEAYTLSDYGQRIMRRGESGQPISAHSRINGDTAKLLERSTLAAKQAGIDLTGSPEDVHGRIADYLEARNNHIQAANSIAESGSVQPFGFLGDEKAKEVAKAETVPEVKKSLDGVLPQSTIDKVAPAITQTKDPNIVRNLINPEVEKTLQAVKTVSPTVSRTRGVLGEVKSWFTPGGGVEGKTVANDLRATTGSLALQKNTETLAAKPDIKFFDKMSSGDHANFIQKVETGTPQTTPELQAMADKLRTAQETDYKLGQSLKPDLVHVENYFPRAGFWDNSKGEIDSFLSKWQQPSLGGSPTALEHRSIPTIYDGIAAGLKPKETNPAIIALNSRTQLLRAKAAQDFIEEQVAKGHDPALVQDYVNRVLDSGLSTSPVYKTVRDATYAVNNLQLGFSGFHVASTGINAVVSQFANGLQDLAHGNILKGIGDIAKAPFAPVDYIFKGSKILKDYKAGNLTEDIKNIAEGGGRIGSQVDYRTTGLAKSLQQIKSGQAGQIAKGVAAAPFRAFSSAAKPVMEYWVPRIKAGATKELIDRKLAELGPNATPEAIRAAKAVAIDSIDNRFGQLVKDNLLWNKTLKDGGSLLMRSPGWNIGTVREIGGGLTDLASKTIRGKGLTERSAYTASLAATTMMIGTALSYMFTGKPPQDLKDYFYPKTGKTDKNGNEERVALPTYAKDIFAFSHNPAQTVANKANPLISTVKEVATNKDYFGNLIRNPQDSASTQLKQTAGFVGKNLLPFSITNANQRVEKTPNTRTQSFFGLTPAPGYITKSGFEQNVQTALNRALGNRPLTPEEQKLIGSKSQAKQAYKAGDNSKIDQLLENGDITYKQAQDLKTASKQTSIANQFAYLLKIDRPAAADLLTKASPDDLKKLGDLRKLRQALQSTVYSGTAKKSTIDASKRMLEYINKLSNPKGK